MYQEDYRTSVSLMRSRDHVNQRRISKDKAVLAFDPIVSGVPPVRIVDRECESLEEAATRYATLVQSIRMVSCDRRNVWAPSERRFSAAAIGVDRRGRVLFIHARTAWPVHELVKALLAAPLDLVQAMYVEGGPEAQLFARGGGREVERVGTFEGAGANGRAWPVPNVVAAVRKGVTGALSALRRGARRLVRGASLRRPVERDRTCSQRAAPLRRASADPQHDLPEVAVLLHHPVRLDDLRRAGRPSR